MRKKLIFKRITLIGGGWIGAGFAIRAAKRSCIVMTPEFEEMAKTALEARLQQAVDKGKMSSIKRHVILERIFWNTDWKMACDEFRPDILIDATTEDRLVKTKALQNADAHLLKEVPRVTVTSALDGEAIGFDAGEHPMSPVEINKGLELVIYKKHLQR